MQVVFNDDSRIIPVELSHEYEVLHMAAYDAFDIESLGGDMVFCLAYTDEGRQEHVGIYSQDELDDAIATANRDKRKYLKIYIVPTTTASPPKNVAYNEHKEDEVIQPGAQRRAVLSKNSSTSSVRDPKQQREGSPMNKIESNRQNSLRHIHDDDRGAGPGAAAAPPGAKAYGNGRGAPGAGAAAPRVKVGGNARMDMGFFDALRSPSFHSEVVAANERDADARALAASAAHEEGSGVEGIPYRGYRDERKEAPKNNEQKIKKKLAVVSEAARKKMNDLKAKGLRFDRIPSSFRSRFGKHKDRDFSSAEVKTQVSSVAAPPSSIPSLYSRQPSASAHPSILPSASSRNASHPHHPGLPTSASQQTQSQQAQMQQKVLLQAAAQAQQQIAVQQQSQLAALQQQQATIAQQQALMQQQLQQVGLQKHQLQQQRQPSSRSSANGQMQQQWQQLSQRHQHLQEQQQQLTAQQQQVQQQQLAIQQQQANPLTQQELIKLVQQQQQHALHGAKPSNSTAQQKPQTTRMKSIPTSAQPGAQQGRAPHAANGFVRSPSALMPPAHATKQEEAKPRENPRPQLTHRESALLDAIKNDDPEIATAIIKKGVNIECVDENGDTPLSLAVQKVRFDCLVFIICTVLTSSFYQKQFGNE